MMMEFQSNRSTFADGEYYLIDFRRKSYLPHGNRLLGRVRKEIPSYNPTAMRCSGLPDHRNPTHFQKSIILIFFFNEYLRTKTVRII